MKNKKILFASLVFALAGTFLISFSNNAKTAKADEGYTTYEVKDLGLTDYDNGKFALVTNSSVDNACVTGTKQLSDKSEVHLTLKSGTNAKNFYITVGGYGVYVSQNATLRFIYNTVASEGAQPSRNYVAAYTGSTLLDKDLTNLTSVIKDGKLYSDYVDLVLKVDTSASNAVVSFSVNYSNVTYRPYINSNFVDSVTYTAKATGINDNYIRFGTADGKGITVAQFKPTDGVTELSYTGEELYNASSSLHQTSKSLSEDKEFAIYTYVADGSGFDPYFFVSNSKILKVFNAFDTLDIKFKCSEATNSFVSIYSFFNDSTHAHADANYNVKADTLSTITVALKKDASKTVSQWRIDYFNVSASGSFMIKSITFRNADGSAVSGLVDVVDPAALKEFTNDQFEYDGDVNIYGNGYGSEPHVYNATQAATKNVPTGYSGAVLAATPLSVAGVGVSLDFTKGNIPVEDVESITIRMYLKTGKTTSGAYPYARIISDKYSSTQIIGTAAYGNGISIADDANKWMDFVIGANTFNSNKSFSDLCNLTDTSILGRFNFHMRTSDSSLDTLCLYIDSVTVKLIERKTIPFTEVASGWNNRDKGENKETILYFETWGEDYFASSTSSVNQAVENKEIGTQMTINGIRMCDIEGSMINYAHGYGYLYFYVPNYVLQPSNGFKVTTLEIIEGTKFMSQKCGAVLLYLSDGQWSKTKPETTSDTDMRSLNDYFGIQEVNLTDEAIVTNYSFGDFINFKVIFKLENLDSSLCMYFFNTNFKVEVRPESIELSNDGSEISFVKKVLDINVLYLLEIEIEKGTTPTFKVGIDGQYVTKSTYSLDTSISNARMLGRDAYVKNYTGADFKGPTITSTGLSVYYFNQGDKVYDFTNVFRSHDLKDGDLSSEVVYSYEEGAVTDNKYNAGVWTLTVSSTDSDENESKFFVTIVVYGPGQYSVTIGEEVKLVNSGDLLEEPETPSYKDNPEYTYTFDGWYVNGEKWDFVNDRVYEDIVLVPVFIEHAKVYTLNIHFEGIEMDDISLKLAYKAILDLDVFEIEGYTFEVKNGDTPISEIIIVEDTSITVTYTKLHVHTYTYVEEVPATKDHDGVKAHYICEEDGKLFLKDGEEYIEVTEEELVIKYEHEHTYTYVEEVPATKEHNGVKAHYVCEECGKLFIKDGDKYIEVSQEDLIIRYQNPDEPVDPIDPGPGKKDDEKKSSGCGGSLLITAGGVTLLSILGLSILLAKRKEDLTINKSSKKWFIRRKEFSYRTFSSILIN